ncbi:MAG TPA: hypothetical protein VHH88_05860, partial [Verrucomicrobiae bacterium]|nr:hypothetical protein [Verrucomicrobiae bacterium]
MNPIQTRVSKEGLGSRGVIVLLVLCAMVAAFSPGANAVAADAQAAPRPLLDSDLKAIRFDQNLNGRVSPDLRFVDETGRNVRLGDYLGKKPVILVPGYYKCPMLCTLVFNGLVECLGDMRWTIGDQFNVLMVSINPEETPTLAAAKKRTYLKRY